MSRNTTIDILKQAILLEQRGKAFYSKAAHEATNESVKRFFALMAEEETRHIAILAKQFKNFSQDKQFDPISDDDDHNSVIAQNVMTGEIVARIAAAGFESAAIAAAMAMEKEAVRIYSERAQTAENEKEKVFYQWLADWEKTHLQFLSEIDQAIKESIWHDNNFWPY